MDLPRVLQARDLILFWLAVGAISGSVVAGAVLIVPERALQHSSDTVVIACEAPADDVLVIEASAGNAAVDGCRGSPDGWTPPY